MKIRIGMATYGLQQQMVKNLKLNMLPDNVELLNMNLALSDLAVEATRLEKRREVDAFVASGGNAAILEQIISEVPIVTISPNAYDVIRVLQKVSLHTERVGCIFYEHSMPDVVDVLKTLKDLINFSIIIRTYSNKSQLRETVKELSKMGICDIVGGSLALKMAAEYGLHGHYIVTESGLTSAICNAVELVRSRYAEIMQSRQLYSVLNFISEGIIATNQDDVVTIFNPSAEKIFGIRSEMAIGKEISRVLKNTRLDIVRQTGVEELNQIQNEGLVKVLTNRIPILSDGNVIGALATFRDINDIEQAEAQIRDKLYTKGFVAKHNFSNILGESTVIKKTIYIAKEFAKSDATLLIQGESGTGKELFAQSIHNASARRRKPFVAVNCAAISQQLLDSELFGYEEGAFTGAKRGGKRGVFELADNGTVFLDEITEISLETQAHLLRVIEQQEVMRLGSEKIRPIDIRIISATNKNLWQLVQQGKFRKDLYYRLNTLFLRIPPLSQRTEDIPVLFFHYLKLFCPHIEEKKIRQLSQLSYLTQYLWPGNIRELRNIIERFSAMSFINNNYEILLKEIIEQEIEEQLSSISYKALRTELNEEEIKKALQMCHGNREAAAGHLGISRSTLWRKMKALGIKAVY